MKKLLLAAGLLAGIATSAYAAFVWPIVLQGTGCALGVCDAFDATLNQDGTASVTALGTTGAGTWTYNARKKVLRGSADLGGGTSVTLKGTVDLRTSCVSGTFSVAGLGFPVSGTFDACRLVP